MSISQRQWLLLANQSHQDLVLVPRQWHTGSLPPASRSTVKADLGIAKSVFN